MAVHRRPPPNMTSPCTGQPASTATSWSSGIGPGRTPCIIFMLNTDGVGSCSQCQFSPSCRCGHIRRTGLAGVPTTRPTLRLHPQQMRSTMWLVWVSQSHGLHGRLTTGPQAAVAGERHEPARRQHWLRSGPACRGTASRRGAWRHPRNPPLLATGERRCGGAGGDE
jgi:hypothetical protein